MNSILDQWETALQAHPNFSKTMSHPAKIAILCQTMTQVTGKPKGKDGWDFFFKIKKDEYQETLEVFSRSHKLLRTYIEYDFEHPILQGTPAQEQAIEHLFSAMFNQ